MSRREKSQLTLKKDVSELTPAILAMLAMAAIPMMPLRARFDCPFSNAEPTTEESAEFLRCI